MLVYNNNQVYVSFDQQQQRVAVAVRCGARQAQLNLLLTADFRYAEKLKMESDISMMTVKSILLREEFFVTVQTQFGPLVITPQKVIEWIYSIL